jgi:hypothetical protein
MSVELYEYRNESVTRASLLKVVVLFSAKTTGSGGTGLLSKAYTLKLLDKL